MNSKSKIKSPKSKNQEVINNSFNFPEKLTILPLRDVVMFPNMVYPLLVGRNSSLQAVALSIETDKYIFAVNQINPHEDDIKIKDLYEIGTISKVKQVLKLPNGLIKILLEGQIVGKISKGKKVKDHFEGTVEMLLINSKTNNKLFDAYIKSLDTNFEEYLKNDMSMPIETILIYKGMNDYYQKIYFIAASLKISIDKKYKILSTLSIKNKILLIIKYIQEEIELKKIEKEILDKVSEKITKIQKKVIIREQIKQLQSELEEGDNDEGYDNKTEFIEEYSDVEIPERLANKVKEELNKLNRIPKHSSEFPVQRNYLEWIYSMPWNKYTVDNLNINHVKKILDEDHFELIKPKERILEFIAVLNLGNILRKQILCFVGPPGVGKTSLAKSIARALGRNFVRLSLGGVRDEAEIRGHRRTYIGAMPGNIIQSMRDAKSNNPVFLLDEIDKMSQDFRGDPASALLEVLDPEQNTEFTDNYLGVDYDLSRVLFITTANIRYDIPAPLLDRMEIIELNSYVDIEKLNIAKLHLIPKVISEMGAEMFNFHFDDEAILKIIHEQTKESGVRNLEREISNIIKKIIKAFIVEFYTKYPEYYEGLDQEVPGNTDNMNIQDEITRKILKEIKKKYQYNKKGFRIDTEVVDKYFKTAKYRERKNITMNRIGAVTGLAWTSVGGDIMNIESTIMTGREKLILTGKLGDVMKESAMTALSFLRSNAKTFRINPEFLKNKEIHIHVPDGAIPKDGPSAGITIATAILSTISNKEVLGDIAMTGEITLRGDILPIGGLKEKLLAAKRNNIKTVIIPEDNMLDLNEFEEKIIDDLKIIPVKNFFETVKYTLAENKNGND